MRAPTDVAARIATLRPWPQRALAAGAGAVSVLAFAPFFVWPVLFFTLPVLVWLIDTACLHDGRKRYRQAALVGWWFGFGFFTPGLYWIGEAFLVEAEKFAALLPVAVTTMPAGLALFWAAAAAAASAIWVPGWPRLLSLALTLSVAEWLRGHVLTGFPWNVIGYALTASDAMMQTAAVVGIYGLSLVAVTVFALPLVSWQDARVARAGPSAPLVAALVVMAGLSTMWGWGTLRLSAPLPPPVAEVVVRVVQPSIPQREKWQGPLLRRNFDRHLQLSRQNAAGTEDGARGIRLLVWPEAAMPFRPLETPVALSDIGVLVPDGAYLAAGLLRVENAETAAGNTKRRVLNSIGVFDTTGRPVEVYDKIHLVPFGEYLPFQSTLEAFGLEQLTRIRGGFDIGPSPRPLLRIPGLPTLLPLVCYEVIFPAAAIQGGERPRALLNVTNDGWFGDSTGPHQHLHQARVRAVEEGLPLIRAANNGISAIVDARGQFVARLGLNVVGVIDAPLPQAIPPPPYARFGDWFFALMLVLTGAALFATTRRRLGAVAGNPG